MTIRKIWKVKNAYYKEAKGLANHLNISPLLARLLINRGYKSAETASHFLKADLNSLSSPYQMKGIEQACKRLFKAINNREKVLVYGDYDVDGITSTSLLVEVFKSLGLEVDYYIPNRIDEGYGLNFTALKKIAVQDFTLVVTVDCGITAKEDIYKGKELGLDFIVTDHHQIPEELPNCLVINPLLDDSDVAWKNLSGVGIAFKLAQALLMKLKNTSETKKILDLVALGTVADLVPLNGENRILVKNGLEMIKKGQRVGLVALCTVANLDIKNLNTSQIAYGLAPRINACGRIGDASLGVELLLSSNLDKALAIAEKLDLKNRERQTIEQEITNHAFILAEQMDLDNTKVLVLASEKWHTGIIGIVASRLVEKYHRPTILFGIEDGICKGSGRSIPNFHLYQALKETDDLLIQYGGHSQAAGLSLVKENLDNFRRNINYYADKVLNPQDFVPVIKIEEEINLAEVNNSIFNEIELLEPFGYANPKPLLAYRRANIKNYRKVGNGKHLKLNVLADKSIWDAIGFSMGELDITEGVTEPVDLAFYIEKNNWNGKENLQLVLKDIKKYQELDNPFETPKLLDRLFKKGKDYLCNDIYSGIENKEFFYTKVVGVTFENRQKYIQNLQIGDKIELVREPDNEYDSLAIGIFCGNYKIGYLKKELAKYLAPNIDKGVFYEGYICNKTGGKDKNLGVNIFVEREIKEDKNDYKDVRKNIENLDSLRINEIIKKAIIGNYNYREKQLETLKLLDKGDNVLAIMGTGRGKSAIFQTKAAKLALTNHKKTIIIYPLRALVNDQYLSLKNKLTPLGLNIWKATGALEPEEKLIFFNSLDNIDIILTTPEFLMHNIKPFAKIKNKIGLVVIDECHHLVSRRLGYKALPKIIEKLDYPQLLAVTATANENLMNYIKNNLSIVQIVLDRHVRKNLNLIDSRGCRDKIEYIKKLAQAQERTVIYVNSRKKALNLAANLRRDLPHFKDKIAYYHGGLNNEDRQEIENLFREGSLDIIFTTSAFGEGIDIPDINNVVLYHLCFSTEEYNQLAGRAGRNGQNAKVHLLYNNKDKELNRLLLSANAPNRKQMGQFYVLLTKIAHKINPIDLTNNEIAEWGKLYNIEGLHENSVSLWLGIFEELALLEREKIGNKRFIYLIENPPQVNLSDSARFLEGQEELMYFNNYLKYAFHPDRNVLLDLINKPIIPTSLIENKE